MTEQFNDIVGKKLPYHESEQYLDQLLDTATDNAIKHRFQHPKNRHWGMVAASVAAVSLLVLGIGFKLLHDPIPATTTVTLTGEGPLDEFLNSLSDEEAAQLQYYEIEEIPEY